MTAFNLRTGLPLRSWLRAGLLLMILFAIQGCAESKNPAATDPHPATVTGTVPFADSSSLIFQNEAGATYECAVRPDSSFTAHVPPDRYHIFLKTASGSLQLVKTSVIVEEYLTVNFLEVKMVPVPAIVSVSVPVIYDESAVIEWETDIESDGRVDYGTDQTYGFSSHTSLDLRKTHRVQIFGLNPSTPYHFRVVAGRHGLESIRNFSREFSFTTTDSGS